MRASSCRPTKPVLPWGALSWPCRPERTCRCGRRSPWSRSFRPACFEARTPGRGCGPTSARRFPVSRGARTGRRRENKGGAMATRIASFDDWVDLFRAWRRDIGLDSSVLGEYRFDVQFGELGRPEIEFGAYAGQKKWDTLLEVPDQRIRDALLNLIRVQGDTEFASTEQQRFLFDAAPSDEDRRALARVVCEECRHGWQMAYLLVTHFGSTGRVEAQKLLERRAFKGTRLLGSFNQEVNDWLDLLVYTEFVDRDGKHQLKMESFSAFAPFARSTVAMLKEEQF